MQNITIDIGTTTIKCALFTDGKLDKYFGKEYNLFTTGKSVEQDAQEWCDVIAEGIASFGELEEVGGVCISSQGITMLPVDENGKPLSRAVSWLDTDCEKELDEFQKEFGEDEIFNITGKIISPYYSLPKIKKMVDGGIKAAKFLMPSDYIYFLLTGEYYTDYTMASGTMMFDINKRQYDKKLLDFCGISESQVAKPVVMGEKIGTVTKEGEKIFGVKEGTPVIMGAQDQKIAAYACSLTDGVATVSVGTSTAISVLKSDGGKIPTFAYNKKDLIYEQALNTTGAAIKWLKNIAFTSYDEMDKAAEAAIDSNGAIFSSDFTDGAQITKLDLSVEKGNLVVALYEDIARKIKALLPDGITELVLFGGGAKSKPLCDIIARITNCKISVPESVETALEGADLLIRNYYNRR